MTCGSWDRVGPPCCRRRRPTSRMSHSLYQQTRWCRGFWSGGTWNNGCRGRGLWDPPDKKKIKKMHTVQKVSYINFRSILQCFNIYHSTLNPLKPVKSLLTGTNTGEWHFKVEAPHITTRGKCYTTGWAQIALKEALVRMSIYLELSCAVRPLNPFIY